MAEVVGFEPTVAFRPLRFSSPKGRAGKGARGREGSVKSTSGRHRESANPRPSRQISRHPDATDSPILGEPNLKLAHSKYAPDREL